MLTEKIGDDAENNTADASAGSNNRAHIVFLIYVFVYFWSAYLIYCLYTQSVVDLCIKIFISFVSVVFQLHAVHWNEDLFSCYEDAAKSNEGIMILSTFLSVKNRRFLLLL